MSVVFLTLYLIVLLAVCYRILFYADTPSKALAYLFLVVIFPVAGIILYFSIGLNYRKRKLYKKKLEIDKEIFPKLTEKLISRSTDVSSRHKKSIGYFYPLANFHSHQGFLSDNNTVQLLINGEEKFAEVLKSLKSAKQHIHIQYYIYENDEIGNKIAQILIDKAKEGVEVRFIYDDFGSKNIRNNIVKKLKESGVEARPFYKINLILLANRINYRNHRKIIIIDGTEGYVGGINVADKYINNKKNKLFWRDTHLKITGPAVFNLQFVFLTDWNFCANQNIAFSRTYFPISTPEKPSSNQLVQIVSSGPDSDYQNIKYTLIQAILLAKDEICITTPYFIPDKSFSDAIIIAALSGVKIKLLIPGVSDSWTVNLASHSFFQDLLNAGVEIYKYQKGFVHAKTMVCDKKIMVVGTANLDNRSFDLNFEINAVVFDEKAAQKLAEVFYEDIQNATPLTLEIWKKRPFYIRFFERVFHLFSPLM
ncbi:cardiolipin synthase [Tenacibaculum sp. UWU-22]|uniref:cardiolipin synthase n=1 Tax=Tenacibaculum sp. UWU-22 TaxID=3234187 RepID=UPI0034DB22F2